MNFNYNIIYMFKIVCLLFKFNLSKLNILKKYKSNIYS